MKLNVTEGGRIEKEINLEGNIDFLSASSLPLSLSFALSSFSILRLLSLSPLSTYASFSELCCILVGTGYKPVSLVPYGDFLFVGTNGQARAYDLRTDQMLWKVKKSKRLTKTSKLTLALERFERLRLSRVRLSHANGNANLHWGMGPALDVMMIDDDVIRSPNIFSVWTSPTGR